MLRENQEGELRPEAIRKIRESARGEALQTIASLRKAGFEVDIVPGIETPETITIKFKDEDGKERTSGFMKVNGVGKMIEENVTNPKNYPEN